MRASLIIVAITLASSAALAGTRLAIESIAVDGQEIRKLQCTLQKGGLFAGAALVGTIAKHKKALDACGPKGEAAVIDFTWAGGNTTKVSVTKASSKKAGACIAKVFQEMKPTLAGTCSAVVLVGDAKKSNAAADALVPAAE